MRKFWPKLLFLVVVIVAIFFRFYKINTLPGEIFGDMSQNLMHVDNLLKGDYRLIYGYDGREGMWFYLVALVAKIFGNNYFSLKIAAGIIGTLTVIMLFILTRELTNFYIGLTAALLMAVSKWNVVFSRIGFRVVLVPLFVSAVIYTYVRAKKTKNWFWYVMTGGLMGLGMYTYPAFKLMIAAMILIMTTDYLLHRNTLKRSLLALLTLVIFCIPLAIDMNKNPEQYTSHTKQMLLNEDGVIRHDWMTTIGKNIINQSLMFNYQGDLVFRVNPSKQPMLDPISGAFFWIGIIAWLFVKKKENLLLLVVFCFMQLPSILVLNNPQDIPSATRSLGVTPIVHIMTAYGLWFAVQKIKLRIGWRHGLITVVLILIGIINWHNYFTVYAYGLPNHNEAYDRVVADYIEKVPDDVEVVMFDCCWADMGTPEPEGIDWIVKGSRHVRFIKKSETLSLNENTKTLIILPPTIEIVGDGYYNDIKYDKYGKVVFKVLKNYDER
ncbi:MAG: glycosyltransferase family 39 protein [Candidatus Shapirobacteria bacterium]|jgi:hypothetical protein